MSIGLPTVGNSGVTAAIEAVGRYLLASRVPPWLGHENALTAGVAPAIAAVTGTAHADLSATAYFGGVAALSMLTETGRAGDLAQWSPLMPTGPVRDLTPYIARRLNGDVTVPSGLPDLPLPDEFRQIFRGWAMGRIDFTTRRHA
jgi:hypothetical protein